MGTLWKAALPAASATADFSTRAVRSAGATDANFAARGPSSLSRGAASGTSAGSSAARAASTASAFSLQSWTTERGDFAPGGMAMRRTDALGCAALTVKNPVWTTRSSLTS